MEYSINDRAKNIMGLRCGGGIAIDLPRELGYVCPVCKNKSELLHWSEYNGFLWCEKCNKDYPTPLCCTDIDKGINIFLDIIQEIKDLQSLQPTERDVDKLYKGCPVCRNPMGCICAVDNC